MTYIIDSRTGEDLKIGTRVKTFRGEEFILEGFYAKSAPSTGRVILRKPGSAVKEEYYPAVIGAAVVEDQEVA